jgi:K+-sensing histidine kinase KdpD
MSQEILDLIRNALDANLLTEGKSVVFEGAVAMADLLEEAISPCREKAKAADIALVIDYAQDLPEEVSTDVIRLKQVIRNLVNQAIEFPERETVQVTVQREAEVLEVTVSGLRLDGEQEPRRESELDAGGLESIREQLESLAGHMHVVSRSGLGYEVTLCLPCL